MQAMCAMVYPYPTDGARRKAKTMTAAYRHEVRKFHPTGYSQPYFAGAVVREGSRRAREVCKHQHTTEAEAVECAQHLAKLRNLGM